MKKSTLLPLTIVAALALAGCGSTQNEAGAPAASTSAAPTTAASSGGPDAAAKPAGTQLDAQSLSDIAQEVAGDNSKAVIVDKDALVAQLPLAEQQMKSMKIEPAKCATFVSADLSAEFDKMNMISMVLPGESATEGIQVAVASYKDPADAVANLSNGTAMLEDCSAFSMSMQGQTVNMKVSEVKAKTSADITSANRSLVKVPGAEISTLAVSAVEGNNLVTVSIMGGTEAAEDVEQAQDMVDTILEMISAQAS